MNKFTITKEKTYFKNYDIYSDPTPDDTVRIQYATLDDVKKTIKKLEKIYKAGERPHARISKIANVMNQRLRVINKQKIKNKDKRYILSDKYFEFLKKRTKIKGEDNRKKLKFNY